MRWCSFGRVGEQSATARYGDAGPARKGAVSSMGEVSPTAAILNEPIISIRCYSV